MVREACHIPPPRTIPRTNQTSRPVASCHKSRRQQLPAALNVGPGICVSRTTACIYQSSRPCNPTPALHTRAATDPSPTLPHHHHHHTTTPPPHHPTPTAQKDAMYQDSGLAAEPRQVALSLSGLASGLLLVIQACSRDTCSATDRRPDHPLTSSSVSSSSIHSSMSFPCTPPNARGHLRPYRGIRPS